MNTDYVAAFMVGMLGAGHCLAMCGGISAAIGHGSPKSHPLSKLTPLFYNLGRILSYTLIGGLVGYTAQLGLYFGHGYDLLVMLRFLAGLTLIFIGLYIAQLNASILILEKLGRLLWHFIQPVARQFMPLRSPYHALPLGFLWGWLPCGLVYSALTLGLASGSAISSAAIMFSFGLGTFPAMFLVGGLSSKFNGILQDIRFKRISGLVLIIFGIHIIYIAVTQLSA